ncbi:monofunctional biosynthetic peptidoglycan transglycosylase, partial [Bacillus paranthracis]|nr:monofunctional biosynthetic peptidoglycan transglycosylase [Bacillus paranthracis]
CSDNRYGRKTNLFLSEDIRTETAKQFGIKNALKDVPALALCTSTVKPIEMVNGYSMFANGGREVKPTFTRRIMD